jgi:hypothetical protein
MGCNEAGDAFVVSPIEEKTERFESGVFLLNEGNFGWGQATLGFYQPEEGRAFQNIFQAANGYAIGNILQSMEILNDTLAVLVVNNSQKLLWLNPQTLAVHHTTEGLLSPRYFKAISDSMALVTDLYADAIHVIDLRTKEKNSELAIDGWTEQIERVGLSLYISNKAKNAVHVLDAESLEATSTFNLKHWIIGMAASKQEVVALTYDEANKQAFLHVFSESGKNTTLLEGVTEPKSIAYNPTNKSFYLLGKGLWRLKAGSSTAEKVLTADWATPYHLAIDPTNGDVYVADALDYLQDGLIYRYDLEGELLDSFTAGVIPGGFAFYYPN